VTGYENNEIQQKAVKNRYINATMDIQYNTVVKYDAENILHI